MSQGYEIPSWFNATAYFNSKLASLGGEWTASALTATFNAAGYATNASGLYSHFVNFGNAEGISPNFYFNTWEYLRNKAIQYYQNISVSGEQIETMNQMIRSAGMTPWEHYTHYGWRENINPSSSFDAAQYFQDKAASMGSDWSVGRLKQAFADAGLSPVQHFLAHGFAEGLQAKPVTSTEIPDPGPEQPNTGTSAIHIQLIDVVSSQMASQPLLNSPYTNFTFTYTPVSGSNQIITLWLDTDKVSGPYANYDSLTQAFWEAIQNNRYPFLLSVAKGDQFEASVEVNGFAYSSIGYQLVLTASTGKISTDYPGSGWGPSTAWVPGVFINTQDTTIPTATTAAFLDEAVVDIPGSDDVLILGDHGDNTVVLGKSFGNDTLVNLGSDDKFDVSALLDSAPQVGTNDEYKQDNGITIKSFAHEEANHIFTMEEFIQAFVETEKLADVAPHAKSIVILNDDQTYTFFLINNDSTTGAGADEITLIGSITTDGAIIDAATQFIA